MKILFVCRQNIGRSQMAAGLYRLSHPNDQADSAGTVVDKPGQALKDVPAPKTIAAMQELGVDVSNNTRQQVTPQMLDDYDKIVVMSEPQNTPDWLKVCPKAEIWDIKDTKDMDLAGARLIRDQLRARIEKM
jgi:protein-tyrosine-phosphatase